MIKVHEEFFLMTWLNLVFRLLRSEAEMLRLETSAGANLLEWKWLLAQVDVSETFNAYQCGICSTHFFCFNIILTSIYIMHLSFAI